MPAHCLLSADIEYEIPVPNEDLYPTKIYNYVDWHYR